MILNKKPKKKKLVKKDLTTANKELLIVEDNPDNRFLIKAFLKKKNYQLDIAKNGIEAVEKFKSKLYDLVLMDIQMPEMNGYQAVNEIRKWEKENKKLKHQ